MTNWPAKPGVYYVFIWWKLVVFMLVMVGIGIAFGNMIWG